jgi:competence protein ComFC
VPRYTKGYKEYQECFFDRLSIASEYTHPIIKKLLWGLKYQSIQDMAVPLAVLLDMYVPQAQEEYVVTSIPSHAKKVRMRGYNQAACIAQEFACTRGFEYKEVLVKTCHTQSQTEYSREERYDNVKNVFTVQGEIPKRIILVDDVITSGATLEEATRVLKEAGVEYVWCIVVARNA